MLSSINLRKGRPTFASDLQTYHLYFVCVLWICDTLELFINRDWYCRSRTLESSHWALFHILFFLNKKTWIFFGEKSYVMKRRIKSYPYQQGILSCWLFSYFERKKNLPIPAYMGLKKVTAAERSLRIIVSLGHGQSTHTLSGSYSFTFPLPIPSPRHGQH